MLIANPIYDSVFKYLMEDDRVARLFISTIIESKVIEVKLTPRERTAHIPSLGVTVFRLDFSAVVVTAEGERRNVLIELQKADGPDDLRRFRRYLAENYYEKPVPAYSLDNADSDAGVEPQTGGAHVGLHTGGASDGSDPDKSVLPIITIYILGESLPDLKGYSAVKVKRSYFDAVTGEKIEKREPFIEGLTHDSYVVQLSELKKRRRNLLEQMFSIFEQIKLQKKRHLKNYDEKISPEFQPLLDRLYRAALDREILEKMIVERRLKEEERTQKEEERRLKEEERTQKEEERRLKEEERTQKEEERRLKEEERKLREKMYTRALETLIKSGLSEEDARILLED